MVKDIIKILSLILVVSCLLPTSVLAEDVTYGQLQDDLAKAEKELKNNQQALESDKNQIQKDNQKIRNLKKQIEEMSEETTKLQKEIADSNVEIEKREKQTKDLIVYLQMSQGENIYLEYVFGGESITDLVYRLSIVEQITEYNDNMVKELEELITSNEKRKTELKKKEKEHEETIQSLNDEIGKLNNSINKLGELSPSLESEVKSKRELLKLYESQGCSKRSDVIGRDCAVSSANAIFSRPIKTGYVTSFVGYRWGSYHRGLDMGSSTGRNTPLYSIGNGVITSIWKDNNGALCVNIEYKDIHGQYYTAIYAHLSRYANIYVGMDVNKDTIIGYMGDTGMAYGVHLHLEVYPCRYGKDSNCRNWNSYVKFAEKKFNEGFRGAESVISFPSRTYQTWYTK